MRAGLRTPRDDMRASAETMRERPSSPPVNSPRRRRAASACIRIPSESKLLAANDNRDRARSVSPLTEAIPAPSIRDHVLGHRRLILLSFLASLDAWLKRELLPPLTAASAIAARARDCKASI